MSGERAYDRVRLVDTTLCDGELAPGVSFAVSERLELAEALAALGADVVEVGRPARSRGDRDAVRAVAEAVGSVVLAGRLPADPAAVETAWLALEPAVRPRLSLAVPVATTASGPGARERLDPLRAAVRAARDRCLDVEVCFEDVAGAGEDDLLPLCAAAAESGAATLELADTAGRATPAELAGLLGHLRARLSGSAGEDVVWSVHARNDLGLATASTLAALVAGARQARASVNGLGPRAGTAALEEVATALAVHGPAYRLRCVVRSGELRATSRLVSLVAGVPVPPAKPVVGSASRGPGADPRDDRVTLAADTSRAGFDRALVTLGLRLPPEVRERAYARVRELGARKPRLAAADLVAIATEESEAVTEAAWTFQWLAVAGGTDTPPRATVRLARGGELAEADATGDGMIDAACNAVATAVGVEARLVHFAVAAVTPGSDAVGDVTVQVDVGGRLVNARGVSTDVVEASARAFLHALVAATPS